MVHFVVCMDTKDGLLCYLYGCLNWITLLFVLDQLVHFVVCMDTKVVYFAACMGS